MKENKYLTQANYFTRSLFRLDKEIHKDIVYLIQSKIDFYGDVQGIINISLDDYLKFKNIKRKDTYTFSEFSEFVGEIKHIGGAFYNKIDSSFISFNIIDNVQIDQDNAQTLQIELAIYGKIFFFKKALDKYIKEITPKGKELKYSGHTQIESEAIIGLKGLRRKKFFEILSQFKNTGFCKISFRELKMYLGYINIVDKSTGIALANDEQMKLLFIPEDKYEFIDTCPRYSKFEERFLTPAIKFINSDVSKDINNIKISQKIKSGRSISHLVFTFNALGADFTEEEIKVLEFFKVLGLDEDQIKYLLKRIGYKEMYGRYMHLVERKVIEGDVNAKYLERSSKKEIKNISGFLYSVVFPELKN